MPNFQRYFPGAIIILSITATLAPAGLENRIPEDSTLIIPGKGAEKVLLGDDAGTLLRRRGTPDRIARFEQPKELFEHIYAMPMELKIPFDLIYYFRECSCTVFLYRDKVSAVAGVPASRVTDLPVELDGGIDLLILRYGNEGMIVKQKGKNKAYLFPNLGMALFDDEGDGSIDLYIVFPQREEMP